jgi:putative ABC transport system permease protein
VKTGDQVTVELMEGSRKIRQIVVVATIDELAGMAAYMNAAALNRLLNEEGPITSAYLKVDPRLMTSLYRLLKRTPRVSSVWVMDVWLENFYATIARTLSVSTTITVIFAAVIAMGIIYNSARIALSERGRELASLRILGFSSGEVGRMLLGEQAILTAMSIPLGFGMGYLLCYLISRAIDTELMRIPLVFSGRTWMLSLLITTLAAIVSGLLVQRRIRRLNLVEVLKTRE